MFAHLQWSDLPGMCTWMESCLVLCSLLLLGYWLSLGGPLYLLNPCLYRPNSVSAWQIPSQSILLKSFLP